MSDTPRGPGEASDPAVEPVYEAHVPMAALVASAAVVILTVLIVGALDSAQQLLGLAALALVLSAVVTSTVERVGRFIGPVAASLAIHLLVLIGVAVGTGFVLQNLSVEAEALEEYAAQAIEGLGDEGAPGLLSRANVTEQLSEAATRWGVMAVVGEDQAAGIAARLSQLLIVVVLSIFFTLRRERLLDLAVGLLDDRERRRVLREIWMASVVAAAAFLRRTLVVAVLSGLAAGVAAYLLDLPAVALVGTWAAFLSVVPVLGALIGWLPVVVLAFVTHGTERGIASVVITLVALVGVAVLRDRLLDERHDPGSFPVAVALAAGLSAMGLPGAAAGVFVVTLAATAATHDWSAFRMRDETLAGESRHPILAVESPSVRGVPAHGFRMRLSRATVVRGAAMVVLAAMIQLSITRVGPTLVWAIVGVIIAVGLDRPVSWVERRAGAPRSVVVVGGAVMVAAVFVALFATTQWRLDAAPTADEDVPEVVEALENLPLIGDRIADVDLERRFDQLERRAPFLLTRSPLAGQAVGVIGGGLVGLFWVIVTALSALLDGPRLVRGFHRRIPARFSRQAARLAGASKHALAGYVSGSASVAILNAVLVGVVALVIGAPVPVILALWAFTWNFIPQVGAIIGWFPLLVLALAVSPAIGAGTLVFFVIYQAVENNLIQPTIVGQAVDISPLAAFGAALFGAAVGGLIGAVLAIPIVGVGRAVLAEYRREDFPRIRPRPAPVAETDPDGPAA